VLSISSALAAKVYFVSTSYKPTLHEKRKTACHNLLKCKE
jgi:hypothetical protein